MTDRVLVDMRDGIARVTLDRPDKYNGLDLPTVRALAAAPRRIRADSSIRAVVLAGAGAAFCSGLDFASVGRDPAGFVRAGLKLPGEKTNLFQRMCWEPGKDAEVLAQRLLARSPDAFALTKRLLHDTWTNSARREFWTETVLQARLVRGANHRIARAADLAKEPPRFVSRRVR